MLKRLNIKNYALINQLEVDFYEGLSTVTGETGAGKSILLGALALVLGKRADVSVVGDKSKKCVVEADFSIEKMHLQDFFEQHDIDYDDLTTLRREILPSGKSRAFVNDTPTTLNVLNALSSKLIDVHSQHQTLQLADKSYQFVIIDALAGNKAILKEYAKELKSLKAMQKELEQIRKSIAAAREEAEYNRFVFNELESAKLKDGEVEELEARLEELSHFEEIRQSLVQAVELADAEEVGLLSLLHAYRTSLEKISGFSERFKDLFERIQSVYLEFDDIHSEVSLEAGNISFDQDEMERVSNRLQLLFDLMKKYKVLTVSDLIALREEMAKKLGAVEGAEELIAEKEQAIKKAGQNLNNRALKIRKNRQKAIDSFKKQLKELLGLLKMPHTEIEINLQPVAGFLENGKDDLEFLISSDGGNHFEQLKKAASGGEMSRIMLAVKTILSKYAQLPTIIFDEIDTGVSGAVSEKIARVMQTMSRNMQVITITHLPQIAAIGDHHYKVYKEEKDGAVHSHIRLLTSEERVNEIATMLSGSELTESALVHARQLLG